MEAFKLIARAEARKISEIFQRQFDKEVLERFFPNQPQLAYFTITANEERDAGAFVDQVDKLARAGYKPDAEEVEQKSGIKLKKKQVNKNSES